MNKVAASSLSNEVKELLIKMQKLVEIQKSNPFGSDEWEKASEILSGLWPKMAELKAPHPDHIDWSA